MSDSGRERSRSSHYSRPPLRRCGVSPHLRTWRVVSKCQSRRQFDHGDGLRLQVERRLAVRELQVPARDKFLSRCRSQAVPVGGSRLFASTLSLNTVR